MIPFKILVKVQKVQFVLRRDVYVSWSNSLWDAMCMGISLARGLKILKQLKTSLLKARPPDGTV